MNYKNTYIGTISAGTTDLSITGAEPNMGYIGYIIWHFTGGATSGVIGAYHVINGVEIPIANRTLSTKQTAHWVAPGTVINAGDTLRILNDTGDACNIYVCYTYEAIGNGGWTEFEAGLDASSSSSSSSSKSSSSSSSYSSSSISSESSGSSQSSESSGSSESSESSIILKSSSSVSSASSESSIILQSSSSESSHSSASSESSIELQSSSSGSSQSSKSSGSTTSESSWG